MIPIPKLDKNILPYPLPKEYKELLRNWLKKNPWVTVGEGVTFPLETKVLGTRLEIKDGTIINGPMVIKGSGNVSIGKYGGIAENLYIISSNHKMNYADVGGMFSNNLDLSKGPVYIGNNVWIGDNVTILSGVTIGDGAVIGAGSIVTRDIPSFAVAAGVPARIIKYRFSKKIIEQLLDLGWWHWDYKTIFKNKIFFSEALTDQNIIDLIKEINLEDENEEVNNNLNESNCSKFILDGWGSKEEDGRWVEKNQAGLIFKVNVPKKYLYLSFYGYSYNLPQKIKLFNNSQYFSKIDMFNGWFEYKIKIHYLKKGVNTIRLVFERGFSPSSLKQGNDKRILYARFKKFTLLR